MKKTVERLDMVLINEREREAGEFTNNKGQNISYDGGYYLYGIKVGDERGTLIKFRVKESIAEYVHQVMEDIHWGALVNILVVNKEVIEIKVVSDLLAGYFNLEETEDEGNY